MENAIVVDKIDLSIFDRPREVKLPVFSSAEEQEMYEENYRLESQSDDYSFLDEFAFQITDSNHIPKGSLLDKSQKDLECELMWTEHEQQDYISNEQIQEAYSVYNEIKKLIGE